MIKLVELLQAIRASGRPFYSRRADGTIHLSVNLGVDVPGLSNALKDHPDLLAMMMEAAFSNASGEVAPAALSAQMPVMSRATAAGPRTITLKLGHRGVSYAKAFEALISGRTNELILPPSMQVIFEMMIEARKRQMTLRTFMVHAAFINYSGEPLVISKEEDIKPSITALISRYHSALSPILVLSGSKRQMVKGHLHPVRHDFSFVIEKPLLSRDAMSAALAISSAGQAVRPANAREVADNAAADGIKDPA